MRPSIDEVMLQCAKALARRNTCPRAIAGAIVAKDGRIISCGYVGSPPKTPHCSDVGCDIGPDGGCQRTVHAELNALVWAARTGAPTLGATLYSTHGPCYTCAKAIVAAGIKKVVYVHPYRDSKGVELLQNAGVELEQLKEEEG